MRNELETNSRGMALWPRWRPLDGSGTPEGMDGPSAGQKPRERPTEARSVQAVSRQGKERRTCQRRGGVRQ